MIRIATVLLEKDETTGFTNVVALPEFVRAGMILAVQVREDATDKDATAATVYICDAEDGDLGTAPPDAQVFYESESIALTGSAKVASLIEPLSNSPYKCGKGKALKCVANITATAGVSEASTKLHVHIRVDAES